MKLLNGKIQVHNLNSGYFSGSVSKYKVSLSTANRVTPCSIKVRISFILFLEPTQRILTACPTRWLSVLANLILLATFADVYPNIILGLYSYMCAALSRATTGSRSINLYPEPGESGESNMDHLRTLNPSLSISSSLSCTDFITSELHKHWGGSHLDTFS